MLGGSKDKRVPEDLMDQVHAHAEVSYNRVGGEPRVESCAEIIIF